MVSGACLAFQLGTNQGEHDLLQGVGIAHGAPGEGELLSVGVKLHSPRGGSHLSASE